MEEQKEMRISPDRIRGGRIAYVDALKGFAMLCVVLGHVVDGYLDGNTYGQADTAMKGIFNLIYVFHMPLFMMISGYVYRTAYFSGKDPKGKSRLLRQIGNCTAVYLLFSVCWGLFKVLFSPFVNKGVPPTAILMIWAKPIPPYWYLYDLILFYIVFSLPCIRSLDRRVTSCLLLAGSILSQWITVDWFQLSGICRYALFFYLGISMAGRPEPPAGKSKAAVSFIAMAALLEAACWYGSVSGNFEMRTVPVLDVLAAGVISLALWLLFQRVGMLGNNSFLTMIGRHSLEIYVIHCFLTAGFRAVLPRIGIGNAWLSIVMNMAASTALPILFSMLCRRMGIYDLFFKPVTFFKAHSSKR